MASERLRRVSSSVPTGEAKVTMGDGGNGGGETPDALAAVQSAYTLLSEKQKRQIVRCIATTRAFRVWFECIRGGKGGTRREEVIARAQSYGKALDQHLFGNGVDLPKAVFSAYFSRPEYGPNTEFLDKMRQLGLVAGRSAEALVDQTLDEIGRTSADETFDLYRAALKLVEPGWWGTGPALGPSIATVVRGPSSGVKVDAEPDPGRPTVTVAKARSEGGSAPLSSPPAETSLAGVTSQQQAGVGARLWEEIEACAQNLATAHLILRNCASEYSALVESQAKHYEAGRDEEFRKANERMAQLMPSRRGAQQTVEEACQTLENCLADVERSLAVEQKESAAVEVLASLRAALRDAKSSADESVSSRLREGARRARRHLRELKARALAAELAGVGELVSQLERRGHACAETHALLEDGSYLDRPLAEARLRLENEGALLRRSLEEAELLDAGKALEEVETRLRAEELARPAELLAQLLRARDRADPGRFKDVALRLLSRFKDLPVPLVERVRLWRDLVSALEIENTGVALVRELSALLPAPSENPASLVEAVPSLLLAFGVEVSDEEVWQVAAAFWDAGCREWANGIIEAACRQHFDAKRFSDWLLHSGAVATNSQVEALVEGQPLGTVFAVRAWAHHRGGQEAMLDDLPLVMGWFEACSPFPALHAALGPLATHVLRIPSVAALLCVVAVRTGLEASIVSPWLDCLRSADFLRLAEFFTGFQRVGGSELATRLARLDEGRRADEELRQLTIDRNPCGGPAREVWRRQIEPRLAKIRDELKDPRKRSGAIRGIADTDPGRLLSQSIAAARLQGVNPVARETLRQWISAYLEKLPLATERVDLPEVFAAEGARRELDSELHRLMQTGVAGPLAFRLAAQLVAAPFNGHCEGIQSNYPDSRRATFEKMLAGEVEPLVNWRYSCSSAEDWPVAAGEDALERLAGRASPLAAAEHFLKRRRIDLAERLLARLEGSERQAVEWVIRPKIEEAREDQRGIIEGLILGPLKVARAKCSPALPEQLRADLESLVSECQQLLCAPSGQDFAEVDAKTSVLLDLASGVLDDCGKLEQRVRQEVAQRLRRAADEAEGGGTVEGAVLVAKMVLAAAQGDVWAAGRLAGLPPEAPEAKGGLADNRVDSEPLPALLAVPARPVPEPTVEQLSVFTQSIWNSTTVPEGFRALASPNEAEAAAPSARSVLLLNTAKTLHRAGKPTWRIFLANWALDQTHRFARDEAFARAADHAHDVLMLMGGQERDAGDGLLLDEAIVFWLATRIEASHLAMARSAPDWSALSRQAGMRLIGQVVRKYFELRAVDLFAEMLADAFGLGEPVLARLLGTITPKDVHLRGLLVRDLIRTAPDAKGAAVPLVAYLLNPWLESGQSQRLLELLQQALSTEGPEPEALPALRTLSDAAGLPADISERIIEGITRRGESRFAGSGDVQRVSGRVLTSTVYLSRESREIVVEVAYRGGTGSLRNLRAAVSLEHPALQVDPRDRIQEVGLLRPGETKELAFKCIAPPGARSIAPSSRAEGVLLVHGAGEAQLVQRKFSLKVFNEYPHRFAVSPYVAGKCLTNVLMIKGREKETTEIIDKLRGSHTDNFVVIYGMRRIGKSSLLQKLSLDEHIRGGYASVHVDLEHCLLSKDTPRSFLQRIARVISEEVPDRAAKEVPVPVLLDDTECFDGFEAYLKKVAAAVGPIRRLLLLFDEFQMLFERERLELFQDVIKRLRHWIQFLPVSFIAAGTPELKAATVGSEQRLFQLGVPVEIGPLDEKAAYDLVREPVKDLFSITPQATELIVEACAKLPSLIQAVCLSLFGQIKSAEKAVATARDAEGALSSVSEVADYFSFLLAPIERMRLLKLVVRALAEVTLEEKRGAPEAVLEHLRSHGHGEEVQLDSVEDSFRDLADRGLFYKWRAGEWRTHPPLLARHVRQRVDYRL